MKELLELTRPDGKPVWVKSDEVSRVVQEGDSIRLDCPGGIQLVPFATNKDRVEAAFGIKFK